MARWRTPPVSVSISHPVRVGSVDFVPVPLAHAQCGWKQAVHHPVAQPPAATTRAVSVPHPGVSAGRTQAAPVSARPYSLRVVRPWLAVAQAPPLLPVEEPQSRTEPEPQREPQPVQDANQALQPVGLDLLVSVLALAQSHSAATGETQQPWWLSRPCETPEQGQDS